jgi:hypothetical protein
MENEGKEKEVRMGRSRQTVGGFSKGMGEGVERKKE